MYILFMDMVCGLIKTLLGSERVLVFMHKLIKMIHIKSITKKITFSQFVQFYLDVVFMNH